MTIKNINSPRAPAPSDIDWNLIRSFLAVMETGSLTGAARALASTQPTLSRQIELLETQLGMVLFERTGRGLEPSDNAHAIVQHAHLMKASADNLTRAAVMGNNITRPLVRIAASRQVALHILPTMLAGIQALAPDIDLGIVASDEISNLLRRDADIAIRNVRPEQASLIAKQVGEASIQAYATDSYLERHGKPATLLELFNHRLVGGDRDNVFARNIKQAAESCGVDAAMVHVAVRSDDYSTQFAAVKAGLGIGFSLSCMINRHDDLNVIRLGIPLPSVPFWLATHREIRSAPAIRTVFDALSEMLKEELA